MLTSHDNYYNLYSAEALDAERQLLSTFQEWNFERLKAIGVIAVAETMVENHDIHFGSDSESTIALITVVPSETYPISSDGKTRFVPGIEFRTIKKNEAGEDTLYEDSVKIIDWNSEGDRLVIVPGLSRKHKAVILGMSCDLKEFKELDILPNLNSRLTSISSRQDSINRHPAGKGRPSVQ